MPTISVYLREPAYMRLIRSAEAKAGTSSSLATHVLEEVFDVTPKGRKLRSQLEIPEL